MVFSSSAQPTGRAIFWNWNNSICPESYVLEHGNRFAGQIMGLTLAHSPS